MKQYVIFTIAILATSGLVYWLSQETLEEVLEKENQETLEQFAKDQRDCYTKAPRTGASHEISKKLHECKLLQIPRLKEISWYWDSGSGKVNNAKATTGSVIPAPPKWYTAKHQLVLSWSHDYRIYKDRKWAVWKNNNPSGLTWWVSNTLKWLWKERWIEFEKGTFRPKNEWWNYILFSSIEHGLRAKMISIRERWWKATVGHFLAWWWTDYVKLSFPTSKIIKDLSEEEFAELFIQQMKKESPWLTSQLVADKILIIN